MICWTPGLRYAIESNPQISGLIVTPPMFEELARLWLSDLVPRFKIHVSPAWHEDSALVGYRIVIPTEAQFANVNTMNSFELGFLYYAGVCGAGIPPHIRLPFIGGNECATFKQPNVKYAVIVSQGTVPSRTMPEAHVRRLYEGLTARGILPVYLGKGPGFLDTTLTEAAVIMANAQGVFGLDNGLLHLAQCSKVPVFALHTTIDPRLRASPRQPGARTYYFSVDPKKLDCLFCHSKMRYIDHDFTTCLRGHYSCAEGFNPDIMLRTFDKHWGLSEARDKSTVSLSGESCATPRESL